MMERMPAGGAEPEVRQKKGLGSMSAAPKSPEGPQYSAEEQPGKAKPVVAKLGEEMSEELSP